MWESKKTHCEKDFEMQNEKNVPDFWKTVPDRKNVEFVAEHNSS